MGSVKPADASRRRNYVTDEHRQTLPSACVKVNHAQGVRPSKKCSGFTTESSGATRGLSWEGQNLAEGVPPANT